MGTLEPQSNGPLYSNMVFGTLAVDGRAVTLGTVRKGLSGLGPAKSPPCCTMQQPTHHQCTNFILSDVVL